MVSLFDFGDDGFMSNLDENQRRQLMSQGLLDFGAAMLEGAQARGRKPSFGEGLGAGASAFSQSLQQGQEGMLRNQYMGARTKAAEAEMEQAERAREQQQAQAEYRRQALNAMTQGGQLTPEQAAMAQAYPDMADDWLGGQFFPEQPSLSERFMSVGGNLLDLAAEGGPQVTYRSPQKPDRLSASDLVEVMTPEGPRLLPADQASGMQPAGGDGDQRDRKIAYWTQQLGGDEEARRRATGIVDGVMDIEVLDTGRARFIDRTTNTVEEIPIGRGAQAQGNGQSGQAGAGGGASIPSQSLYEAAEEAQGIWPTLTEAWSRTGGQVFPSTINEKDLQARSNLRTATGELIRSMSVNDRFPVAEMERIREETNIQPSMWNSPAAAQADMRELDRSLRSRLQQAERDANDPSLPEETRASQAQNASAIRNFLQRLGAPRNGGSSGRATSGQQGGPPRIQSDQEYNDLPSGTRFIAPDGTVREKP